MRSRTVMRWWMYDWAVGLALVDVIEALAV
jgi:hypothetical protein